MTERPTRPVTIEEVQDALIVAARLVDLYGEQCLPIFERLEAELQELRRRGSAVERARAIAARASCLDHEPARRLVGNPL